MTALRKRRGESTESLVESYTTTKLHGPRNKVFHSPRGSALAGPSITEKEGLERAYQQGDAYVRGDTLFVAGSHTQKHWYDDVTKVPFWGDVRNSTRYQQAEKGLKANPNIRRVVGHSLGGAVALELQKQHPNLQSRTYGAPVWDPFGRDYQPLGEKIERYRNIGDPVSLFDGSSTSSVKWNPFNSKSLAHDYGNIAQKFRTGDCNRAYGRKIQMNRNL